MHWWHVEKMPPIDNNNMTQEVEQKPAEQAREAKPKPTKVTKPFEKIYKEMSAEIPKEHYILIERDDVTLTGYPGQIVLDRLNEIIGLDGWYTDEKILYQELVGGNWVVAMLVKLVISNPKDDKVAIRHGYGAQYATRVEDAFGGAFTNGLKRAARQLGIGKELYYTKYDEDIQTAKVKEEKENIPEEAIALEEKLNKAENVEQLMSLEAKVKAVNGVAVQKVLLKKFNNRKIELSK